MTQFSTRTVVVLDLPVPTSAPLLKPEQVIIRFQNQATVDIGAWCYLKRETASKGGARRAWEGGKVLLTSLCLKRVNQIRALISHMSDVVRVSGKRSSTIRGDLQHFGYFLVWADKNGHTSALDDTASARQAFKAYAAHVRKRVTTHEISLNTGASMQARTRQFLSDFLSIENLAQGINLLRKDGSNTTSTMPPDEVDVGRMLALCEALFNGLTALVLEDNSYPFGIAMPSYLGYPNNLMYVFPTNVWCLPATRLATDGVGFYASGYSYHDGRLATREEIKASERYKGEFHLTKVTKYRVIEVHKRARSIMDDANSDSLHWHRRFMGVLALNAFIPLFLSRTGMNWAQTIALTWAGSYSDAVSIIRQKFRSIKHRAGGKEVYYQLPLNFMPLFKRFLQLRDYLLQGYPNFDGLFFTMGVRATGIPAVIKTELRVTLKTFQRIDPSLTPILSRAWRAGKSDFLLRKTDVATAAQQLQNTEQTIRRSYAGGSVASHLAEMSAFFERMVVDRGTVLADSNSGAVGECVSYGNPSAMPDDVVGALPSCENPEVGCLFCDKFRVHADETDVRKLLSCRYCLTRTSHLAGFHTMSEPLINRIQIILDEISNRDASLVPKIAAQIDEGELDPYWAKKYDMLLRLNLVIDND